MIFRFELKYDFQIWLGMMKIPIPNTLSSMCIMSPAPLPPRAFYWGGGRGGWKIFNVGKKVGTCTFWIVRGRVSKEEKWIFSEGAWGFSESNFQLLIKYHIRYKNVNDSNNHNLNVLYLPTIFKFLNISNL